MRFRGLETEQFLHDGAETLLPYFYCSFDHTLTQKYVPFPPCLHCF